MLLTAEGSEEFGQWTDEDLEKEKIRLLNVLKESEKEGKDGNDLGVTSVKKVRKTRAKPRKKVVRK
jgi:hypothetical protein